MRKKTTPLKFSSGIDALDELIQEIRAGDNLVWQIDNLEDYASFAQSFANRAIAEGHNCIYLRFASHPPILKPGPKLKIIEIDPRPGFDAFSGQIHNIIAKNSHDACYIFDNLSSLVAQWATDELLANFFQVTCPYIFERGPVAYFGLTRGKHKHSVIARIRETTQILIDVYHVKDAIYIHPLKVWERYSAQMFLPHLINQDRWVPVFQSGEAAAVSSTAHRQPLSIAFTSIAPWESVYTKLLQYQSADPDSPRQMEEVIPLKHELSRMMIGDQPAFIKLADKYLTTDDLINIRNRLIGSGRIGGKAAGMLLARRILMADKGEIDFSRALEAHDSFYIGSDVFFTFLVNNHLFQLRLQLTTDWQISPEEFEEIESRFVEGKFPQEIMEQFRDMLDYFGQAPIIVRSSSLLEDSFGNAFAGKYRSEFCANQGTPDERMESFLRAVKLVYASALNPDALTYRHNQGLGENDEQMAILVQRVSGMPYKNFFFPTLAGVAFSKNLYAWTNRIDPQRGMLRLVFGLGTRAVNRLSGDYTRMIAISHPDLRPEIGAKIAKYSQHNIDLLDIKLNELITLPIAEILDDGDYPNLNLIASIMQDGFPRVIIGNCPHGSGDSLVLTFDSLLRKTPFIKVMSDMLMKLESAQGHPVDVEFTAHITADGEIKINLLQCRSLQVPGASGTITIPDNIPHERILFKAKKFISGGLASNLRYILYIDPLKYSRIESPEIKKSVGRIVGRINKHPAVREGKIIMMGPGRWGSSNIDLGVNVGYADISNTSVLVEIAREEMGHVPEVSYGTHFFQDLVESQIIYLPLYPGNSETTYNNEFFEKSTNVLKNILPELAEFADIISLIDVPSISKGQYVQILADPKSRKAICFLK
ncbi:MAG: PEP/pyruvate-binding domain-containing protein [Dehalococcoidia bacterium]|nr:PEP/pyruvate-binding domain-containing protein [Dehalococcoidia bacterium]